MDDRAALLRAILNDPEDDTARLAFADWLDEHDEGVRAEFVRVQVQWGRMPHGCTTVLGKLCTGKVPDWCLACRLKKRARELWFGGGLYHILNHEGRPTPSTVLYLDDDRPGYSPLRRPEAYVSRGFVSHVACSLPDFLRDTRVIFGAHPVTSVTLYDREPINDSDESTETYWVRWLTNDDVKASADDRRIPVAIAEHMPRWTKGGEYRWLYPNRAAAALALSVGCVRYGRALAKLPQLDAALAS